MLTNMPSIFTEVLYVKKKLLLVKYFALELLRQNDKPARNTNK